MESRSAFTLVELLVVIAIIGVLIALLLPAVQAARSAARRTACKNNLKQIGLALSTYADVHGTFPAGWIGFDPVARLPHPEGATGWSWNALLLPYMEHGTVWSGLIHFDRPVADPVHQAARVTVLPMFQCPEDPGDRTFDAVLAELAAANYVGAFGTDDIDDCTGMSPGSTCASNGVLFHNSGVRLAEITDGLSHTFVVGERSSRLGYSTWVGVVPGGDGAIVRIVGSFDHTPNHPTGHFDDFGSYHPGGCHFVMGDGSVQFVSQLVALSVYQAHATRSAGDIATEF
ncbi:MAG: DUF1559 domain-containing protein [Planctomycetia bacterium]|nr:DUF1559 domain-containing protein [Planctomycetia bacterium]